MTWKSFVSVIALSVVICLCGCYPPIEYADIENEMTRHKLRALEKRFEQLNGTYQIGIPDSINISVPDHPDLSGTFEVRPDGNISYPLLNDVYVEGLTPMQLSESLAKQLEVYVKKVDVLVTIVGFYSKQVYAFSRVRQGGTRFPFTGDMSALDLIAFNAGWSRLCYSSRIRLVRDNPEGGKEIYRIRGDQMVRGDFSSNIMVKENDMLYLPAHWWAEVGFAVETATYPFRAIVRGLYEVGAAPYEITRGYDEAKIRDKQY